MAEEKSKDCLGHCGGGKVTRTPILHHLLLSQSAIVNIISVLFSDLLHSTHCRSRYACNKSTFKVSKLTKPCGVHYTSVHQLFFHQYTIEEEKKFHRKGEWAFGQLLLDLANKFEKMAHWPAKKFGKTADMFGTSEFCTSLPYFPIVGQSGQAKDADLLLRDDRQFVHNS